MELKFEKVSKSYGKIKALTEFSATFTPGIYALLGPNGSGKSTLMNILTDNLKRDSGSILYDGEEILNMGVKFREKIGFMPQYPGMYGNFTAEKFLFYIASLKGMKKAEAEEQIQNILEEVELSEVRYHKISSFSGGMKQRLALSSALLGNPSVLILDEPTAGLDPKQRITIRNYISKIAFDKIVLIATHVVSDVEYISKEVIMLKKGNIESEGTLEELLSKIENEVWEITVEEKEAPIYEKQFQVTSLSKTEEGVHLRILSKEKPGEHAVNVTPTLEDYYLSVFEERGV